jgi:signal peptidase I
LETANTRKVNPILAFVAGVFGFGMGYVYVGKIRLAVATIVSLYAVLAIFSWTRLVVYSAVVWWFLSAACFLILVISLIHPVVLAIRLRATPRTKYNRWWVYVIWLVGFNALGYLVAAKRTTAFGYEPLSIPSSSMSPTVEKGDFVLSDTWRYRNHPAVVGEIVIIERPERPGVKYIKRVVGVGGDTIEIRNGVLYRNGNVVTEPYVHAAGLVFGSPRNIPPSVLGPGLIYVLGDYRDNSMDSRQWGPFSTSTLRGRVQYIWFSLESKRVRWGRVGTSLVP